MLIKTNVNKQGNYVMISAFFSLTIIYIIRIIENEMI